MHEGLRIRGNPCSILLPLKFSYGAAFSGSISSRVVGEGGDQDSSVLSLLRLLRRDWKRFITLKCSLIWWTSRALSFRNKLLGVNNGVFGAPCAIHGCLRTCSQVKRFDTFFTRRCEIRSFASSLILSHSSSGNSNLPRWMRWNKFVWHVSQGSPKNTHNSYYIIQTSLDPNHSFHADIPHKMVDNHIA